MSLAGAYDDSNIFAKILRGEMPCAKVAEDAATLAFMDVFPQARGHVLVVPKDVRARNILDLPAAHLAPLMAQVQRVAIAVEKALKPAGIQIMQFNGAPAGQTVFHLHIHVIPRYDGQSLKGHGHGQMAERAELEALAQAIAAELQ